VEIHSDLLPLTSMIPAPTNEEATVTSFPAFSSNFATHSTHFFLPPEGLPHFNALIPSEHHGVFALECLEHMNCSLKYNICNVPEELTVSRRGMTNSPDNISKISKALKYSCLYWASHLAKIQGAGIDLVTSLHTFLHEHLLHWIECLSVLDELGVGLKSLRSVATALAVSGLPKY